MAANRDARNYLNGLELVDSVIDLWDLARLSPVLTQLDKEWFLDEETQLKAAGSDMLFWQGSRTSPDLVYAAVPARMLTKMPGIDDTRIFAQNVRLGLGKTRVNNEILESIKNKNEHAQFLTFHNGLTIVAQSLAVRGRLIKMNQFSVCNGCQSLLTLYGNQSLLTDELLIPVRIVRVAHDRKVAEVIAYRTNNQNAVSLKDLSANDAAQVQLKSEFDGCFGHASVYSIKRGDAIVRTPGVISLPNETAGQQLLSFYCQQPWSAHQKYRIFGDLEAEIFRYGVSAAHIRLAQLAMEQVMERLEDLAHERVRKYSLTKFIVLYLLSEVVTKEKDGVTLLADPKPYLQVRGQSTKRQTAVLRSFDQLLRFIITELNYSIEEKDRENPPGGFDYKTEFKSLKQVGALKNAILKAYDKDKHQKRLTPFTLPK